MHFRVEKRAAAVVAVAVVAAAEAAAAAAALGPSRGSRSGGGCGSGGERPVAAGGARGSGYVLGRSFPGVCCAPAGGPTRAPRALSAACPAVRGLRRTGRGLAGGGDRLRAQEASRRGWEAPGLQAGFRGAPS